MKITREMMLFDAEIERDFTLTREEIRAAEDLDRAATMSEKEWRSIQMKRAWYKKNKNRVSAQKKEYYLKNKDRINERCKAYYWNNREEILAKARQSRRYGYESL